MKKPAPESFGSQRGILLCFDSAHQEEKKNVSPLQKFVRKLFLKKCTVNAILSLKPLSIYPLSFLY